jgi:hypothetical protein
MQVIKKTLAMLWPRTQVLTAAQNEATLTALLAVMGGMILIVFAFALLNANASRTAAAAGVAAEAKAAEMILQHDTNRVALLRTTNQSYTTATFYVVDKEGIWKLPDSEEGWAEKVMASRPEGEQSHEWLFPKDPDFTRADQVLSLGTYTRYNRVSMAEIVGNADLAQQNHLAALRGEWPVRDRYHSDVRVLSEYYLTRN